MLDTSVLIAQDRGAPRWDVAVADDDDVAIAAVTLAELLVGVALADRRHRTRRQAFIDALVAAIPIVAYDAESAVAHAALLVDVRRSGRPRGAHDLLIAACAVATRRAVVTADAAGFAELPGVDLRVL